MDQRASKLPTPVAMSLPTLPGPRARHGQAHIIEGSAPHFSDATTALLRRRLQTAGLVMVALLFLAFLTTLSFPGLGLRVGLLLIVLAGYLILRSARPLSERQLRAIELLVLAAFCVQALFMPDVLILERAHAGDAVTAVMDRYFNTGVWALVVVIYGLFIPNTWRRAALVIVPLSCLPDLNFYLLGLYEPQVQHAFAAAVRHHGAPIPVMLMAALVGVYGAHAMYSIRREAFQAKQLGQYRLRDKLGSGGMGDVYRAEHAMLKRPCAIKLIRPDIDVDADVVARFEREVQVTAGLSHWNTVDIYDYGRTDEGVFYYVMELLSGMSLDDLVKRHGPQRSDRTIYLLRQVCAALREAHALGLVHRDIKPANIFAARLGGVDDVVKLLDFGLVTVTRGNGDAQSTEAGLVSGTPAYMSPEQASADTIDPRSDIYSLGGVAYFLVTGQPPFAGRKLMDVITAHARDPVPPPSTLNAYVAEDLEKIILRCLEKKPGNRFPDVASLDQALAKCACAKQWSADQAAAWWKEIALPEQAPVTEPVPQGETRNILRGTGQRDA